MRNLPSPLGRATGRTPLTETEIRAMAAAAWHRLGILVVPMDRLHGVNALAAEGIGAALYGPRKEGSQHGG